MNVKFSRNTDPFKKYWWVILIGFGLVGAWVCMPMMDSGTGSGAVRGEAALGKPEQSLDATGNPSGAPGGVVDLSMEGSGPYKKNNGPAMSSLYQAPGGAEIAASTNTLSMAKADVKLADALKMVARKSASAAGPDAARPQSGFAAPHAAFGSMGGLPGGSGSGASAASSGGGGSFFGASQANVGVTQAQGLKGSVDADKVPNTGMKSLTSAAQASVAAAKSGSFDKSAALAGGAFDGRSGGGSIGDMGNAGGGNGVSFGSLDAAPAILKVDDPFANKKLDGAAVPHSATSNTDKNAAMKQMMMMMVGTMVIGGLMGASMASMVPAMGMMAMQMAITNQQSDAQAIQQQKNIGGH